MKKIIKEIKKAIEKSNKQYFGLRSEMDNDYQIGDITKKSFIWDDDTPTNEQLPGTCAIRVDKNSIEAGLKAVSDYYGKEILVLAADAKERYDDADYRETLLVDAEVIKKFNYKDI